MSDTLFSDRLIIEPAKIEDAEEIAALIAELAEYEKAPEENVSTAESVRQQLFSDHPSAEVLMARYDGDVAGFALFFPSFSTWLSRPGMYLEDVYIRPQFRRLGVGGEMLKRLAAICVERNYGRLEWACLEWNELAKGFYRKIGARSQEEWRTWRMEGVAIEDLAAGKLPEKETEAVVEELPIQDDTSSERVVVYTDGGCRPNPGVGAWAAVLEYKGVRKELVGGELKTTNNRMEMMAAISALETLKRRSKVLLMTDSQYLKNGITSWIHNWRKKNWMTAAKKPVLNVDLWKRLDEAIKSHDVQWGWVRGHSGTELNERCDELCTAEIDRLQKKR